MDAVFVKKEAKTSIESKDEYENIVEDLQLNNSNQIINNTLTKNSNLQNQPTETDIQIKRVTNSQIQFDKEYSLSGLKLQQYSLHICNICGETFGDIELLGKHYLTSHNGEEQSFKCDKCNKIYPDIIKLKRHKYTHRYELSVNCEVCQRHFTSLPNLKRHMRLHSGTKPFSCIQCKEAFTRRDKVNMHMLNVHGLQLADCLKLYESKNEKNKSPENENSKGEFANNEITKTLTQSENVTQVIINNADNELERFLSNSQNPLSVKSEVDEGFNGFFIDNIEPGTSKHVDTYLFDHSRLNLISKAIGLNYCDICEKDFANLSILKRHMLIHKGDKPFECNQCYRKYRDASKLKEHMKVHDSTSPLFCEVCLKRFTDRANLRRHKLIHSGDKPHVCDLCNKRFNRKDHLKAHRLLHVWNGEVENSVQNRTQHQNDTADIEKNLQMSNGDKNENLKDDESQTGVQKEVVDKVTNFRRKRMPNNLGIPKKASTTKKRSYECDECKKVFTKTSNLKRHKFVHLKKKQRISRINEKNATKKSNQKEQSCDNSKLSSFNKSPSFNQLNIWNPCLVEEGLIKDRLIDFNNISKHVKFSKNGLNNKPEIIIYQNFTKEINEINSANELNEEKDGQGNNFVEICVPSITSHNLDTSYKELDRKEKKSMKSREKIKQGHKLLQIDETLLSPELLKLRLKVGIFACNRCGVVFETRRLLRQHDCPNKEIFTCDDCGKKFLYISTLRTHQVVHSKEKPFECSICMKRFSLVHHLRGHLMVHSGEKPYKCLECSKRFTSSSDLRKHIYSHTKEKNFSCNICQKMFKRPCDVTRHKLTHSGIKPHACGYCSKRFSQAPHLNSHLLVHFREYQPCEFSEMIFGDDE